MHPTRQPTFPWRLPEMSRQHPIKLAFHPFNGDSVRYQIAPREPMPFLSVAKRQVKRVNQIVIESDVWIVQVRGRDLTWRQRRWKRHKPCCVENTRDLVGFKVVRQSHRSVVVLIESDTTRDGDNGSSGNYGKRKPAEDHRLGSLRKENCQ